MSEIAKDDEDPYCCSSGSARSVRDMIVVRRISRKTNSLPYTLDQQGYPNEIMAMDVCHGPPGRTDIPSIAAVVGSQSWPKFSRYGCRGRSQPSKAEMIYRMPVQAATGWQRCWTVGVMRELLLDFYHSSKQTKPAQIVVFRDGVSELQCSQVLDKELEQMIQAYKVLDKSDDVHKFTAVVVQKNHHTRLFQANAQD